MRRLLRARRSESGLVLVLFALLITALLGLAALAVDVGLWYVEAQSVQKAADMAALGGAVQLPGDPSGAATTAQNVASQNGYVNDPSGLGAGKVTVAANAVSGKPNDIHTTVTKTFNSIFGGIVGINSLRISRSATAEYEQPVDMGSPTNVFANQPASPNDASGTWINPDPKLASFIPNMWGNVFGFAEPKQNGDAIQAGNCSFEDGCGSIVSPAYSSNTDYASSGYFYKIAVDMSRRPAGAHLAIEVFDPAAVYVGDHCDQSNIKSPSLATVSNPWTTLNGTALRTDAAVRYAWGDSSNGGPGGQFCTGDNALGGYSMPVTSYVVRADADPSSPANNAAVPQGTCTGMQFPGYSPDLSSGVLDQASRNYDPGLASVFRQWVPVCTLDPSVTPASDYLLQVRTNVAMGGDVNGPGSAVGTGGSNRFAIRAAWVSNTPSFTLGTYIAPPVLAPGYGNGITIAGLAAMGLYANAAAGAPSPTFWIARVLPGGGNQTLRVRLFDIGDCGGGCSAPTLTFLKPDGSAWGDAQNPCSVRVGDTSGSVTPYPSCSLPASANGKWITVDIPVPASYSCTTSDPTDCWTKMTYRLGGAGALNDTTTWTAQILGNPVRLVK